MVTSMVRLLFFVVMLASTPVLARAIVAEKLPPQAGGAPTGPRDLSSGPAEPEKPVSVEEQALLLCQTRQLMAGEAGAPVPGVDYEPGVDAYGNPVVPADGQAQPVFDVPEQIDIPINIDVLKTVGVINQPVPGLSTNVGMVSIRKGGQVLFNGQDSGSAIQTYCEQHFNSKTKATQ